MNDTSGCAKNVHYGDILVKFGESISAEKADLPFICEREILKKLSKSILKNGDVVIADTAEDMTTGKSCEIVDVDECMPVLAGLHTIPVRPKQKFGKYYLGYYLNSEAFHSQLIPLIQGIKVYSISKSSIKDTVVMFPDDVQEQEKIGSLFNRIDNTITLQQRKLNSLQKLKKGLLQKMFPKNGENIPEIRFPEFSDAWKQRKLGEIIDYSNGIGHENYVLPQGKYELVTLKSINSSGKLVCSEKFVNEDFETLKAETLIMMLSEQAKGMLGMTTIIPCDNKYVLNQRVAALKAHNDVEVHFLTNAINNKQNYFEQMGAGTKVQNITRGHVEECVIELPSLEEQKKIGSLFSKLEVTITLQQRKLNSLQKLQKRLLQKMFPKKGENITEIRFPEFSDAWKQRKLEQIIDVGSGRDYKHLSEGGIPVYGTGGYMLSVNEALSWEEDAIGIGRKGTIDKPYILQAPFWTVDTLFYAIPKKEQDLDFLYCIFQNIDWKKKDESTGVPSLSKTIINKTYCMTPNYDEQKKIGCFFSKIDNLITLQQRWLFYTHKQS